jgi:hypothetical protein
MPLALSSRAIRLSDPARVMGGWTSGAPLTVAGAATDLPPDLLSSQDARRSLFTRSRGTIDI